MARSCPSCGTSNANDSARFCGSCGAKLPEASSEAATVIERVAPVAPPAARAPAATPAAEAVEFTAMCPSCGAANPPDTAICEFCGEEIPIDQRRRRTAVFGALGAAGGAGVAGGILGGQGGGGAVSGMAGSSGALSGLGGQGGALSGLGQTPQAMSGLGNAPGGALPGMGGASPSNLAAPPPPAGVGQGMGSAGNPAAGSPPPLAGTDAAAVAPPPAPPAAPPSPPPAVSQPTPQPAPPGSGPGAPVPDTGSSIGGIIIKTVVTGVGIIGGVALGAVVLGGILVFTGDPAPCVERVSTPSSAALTELYAKWNQFEVDAQAGPAVVTFNETEATSRAQQYLDQKNIPLDGAQVYFCPDGRGQVKGRVTSLGADVNVLLEGRVDATQDPPVIVVDEINAGNLPSWFAEKLIDQLDQNDVKTLNFGVPVSSVTFTDGTVTIESPGP